MRSSALFAATIRQGVRVGQPSVVVHAKLADSPASPGSHQVGFVVSKKVGNAITRNRVKRRLRHLVRPLVVSNADSPNLWVVVRALPAAASEPDRLADDLTKAWHKSLERLVVA